MSGTGTYAHHTTRRPAPRMPRHLPSVLPSPKRKQKHTHTHTPAPKPPPALTRRPPGCRGAAGNRSGCRTARRAALAAGLRGPNMHEGVDAVPSPIQRPKQVCTRVSATTLHPDLRALPTLIAHRLHYEPCTRAMLLRPGARVVTTGSDWLFPPSLPPSPSRSPPHPSAYRPGRSPWAAAACG